MGWLTECTEKLANCHAGKYSWGTGFENRFSKWIKWWKEWEKFQKVRAEEEVSAGASEEKTEWSACVGAGGYMEKSFPKISRIQTKSAEWDRQENLNS